MGSTFVAPVRALLSLALLGPLLAAPAPAGASEPAPGLTSADERRLADELLFCHWVTKLVVRQLFRSDPKPWDRQATLFFALGAALVPPAELAPRLQGALERFDEWSDRASGEGELAAALPKVAARCADAQDRNRGWIDERRKALDLRVGEARRPGRAATITYRDRVLVHRGSAGGLHEFKQDGASPDPCLPLLRIEILDQVHDPDGLLRAMEKKVERLKEDGLVVYGTSMPGTPGGTAEHFLAGLQLGPDIADAMITRFVLRGRRGIAVSSLCRAFGEKAGDQASAWMAANAEAERKALLAWSGLPRLTALAALGRSGRSTSAESAASGAPPPRRPGAQSL